MTTQRHPVDRPEPGPGVPWQVVGFGGGMTAYALHLFVGLALVPLSCGLGSTWPIHLATAVTVAAITGSAVVAAWVRRSAAGVTPEVARRRRVLGSAGLFLNGLALMVVLLSDLPNYVLNPCLP
jgi:hypothetical protein